MLITSQPLCLVLPQKLSSTQGPVYAKLLPCLTPSECSLWFPLLIPVFRGSNLDPPHLSDHPHTCPQALGMTL